MCIIKCGTPKSYGHSKRTLRTFDGLGGRGLVKKPQTRFKHSANALAEHYIALLHKPTTTATKTTKDKNPAYQCNILFGLATTLRPVVPANVQLLLLRIGMTMMMMAGQAGHNNDVDCRVLLQFSLYTAAQRIFLYGIAHSVCNCISGFTCAIVCTYRFLFASICVRV